ncbi:MAG: phosphoribosylformylglycinamidine cyclo-ligase [Candidatus Palauibacterales bacterium]|nr:phosphoribosylformylglycinamidine cyclo-ligase [Candidatus Palauibacterales bacterium]
MTGDTGGEDGRGDGGAYTYEDAGVDLDAAEALKERLGSLVASTRTEAVRAEFGSFGGRFRTSEPGAELVASADGVGTKLKVAFRAGRHDTVGQDLVNHCVNDLLAEGAVPLVFLDYVATGELEDETVHDVVAGIARACRENGCALLGGETAEMPGFYPGGEYDLVGFVVGEVAFPEIGTRDLRAGDRLVALPSSGLHTNGYSFARGLLFERAGLSVDDPFPGEAAGTVGEVLLRVHRSYLDDLAPSCRAGRIRALAHVTGGGIPGNLGRVLPDSLDAVVDVDSWEPPAEFRWLWDESGAPRDEIYRTLNMGVGMIAVVREDEAPAVVDALEERGAGAFVCGRLAEGDGSVRLAGRD